MADPVDRGLARHMEEAASPSAVAGPELSQEVFDCLPCMAMVVRGGMVIARNRLARRLTGYVALPDTAAPVEELLGDGCWGVDEEPGLQRIRFDGTVKRRHGPPLRVSVAAQQQLFRGEPGTLLIMLEHTRDLTDAVGSSGSIIEDLMEALPRATVVAHNGRVLHVNREFLELFEYASAEVLGADLDDLVLPEGLLHENEMIQHQLDRTGRAAFETVRRTRHGRIVDIHLMVAPLRLGQEVNGLLITYRDISEQRQQEDRLRQMALHDAVTGLANRSLFLNRAELMLSRLRRRPDRGFAILFVDLDGFKQVNDELGHAAGDAVLLEVADRLRLCVRPQDTVARLGGDEFALLVDETGTEAEMERVAGRLLAEIERMIALDGAEARVSASIGIAQANIAYDNAEDMLRDADIAMYRAKNSGKARFCIWDGPCAPAGVTSSPQC